MFPVLWRCHPREAMDLVPQFSKPGVEELSIQLYSYNVYIPISYEKLNGQDANHSALGLGQAAVWMQPAFSRMTAGLSSYCFTEVPCILHWKLESTTEWMGRILVNKLAYLLILQQQIKLNRKKPEPTKPRTTPFPQAIAFSVIILGITCDNWIMMTTNVPY